MKRLLLAAVLALSFGLPAEGNQKDVRLPALFENLKTTKSEAEAQVVEAVIWQIWSQAGDPATDALMMVALQAMQSGDIQGAFGLFDAITQQAPDFAEGWNKRATILYMIGRIDDSEADVARVLELEPRHFGALAGLGLINMSRGNLDAAQKAFERALAINPHLGGVKTNIETIKKEKAKGNI